MQKCSVRTTLTFDSKTKSFTGVSPASCRRSGSVELGVNVSEMKKERNFKSKHMVTSDYLFIMNHHTTVYRPMAVLIPHGCLCFASFCVNVCMYFMFKNQIPDEVICISGLFTNYILTYNSSDRLADFIGATLLLPVPRNNI